MTGTASRTEWCRRACNGLRTKTSPTQERGCELVSACSSGRSGMAGRRGEVPSPTAEGLLWAHSHPGSQEGLTRTGVPKACRCRSTLLSNSPAECGSRAAPSRDRRHSLAATGVTAWLSGPRSRPGELPLLPTRGDPTQGIPSLPLPARHGPGRSC